MKFTLAKRLLTAGLTLALSVGLLGTSALAAGTVNSVTEKIGSDGRIVVTVYDQDPGSAGTGGQTTVTGDPVESVGINALRIGSVVELTSTDNGVVSTQVAFGLEETFANLLGLDTTSAIASQDSTYYFAPTAVQTALGNAAQSDIEAYLDDDQNGATNKVTGADGVATFDNLAYGLYLLAKSALPADATTDLLPFLVSVPMYVNDAWESTVYAYPKVRTDDITISKTVDDQDGTAYPDDIHVNAGQTLKYTVTTTIPAAASGNGNANGFTSFVVTDTNTGSSLDIDESTVEVKLGETALTPTEDYTVTYSDAQGNSVLTITLTDTATTGGLAELNKNLSTQQTITVTYNATVATDVDFSTKLTNTAKATYQREGMANSADTEEVKVDLYTYGIDLTKTLSEGSIAADTISFELYKDNQGQLGDKIPVTSATGGKSGYWQAASATTSETNTYTMYVGTNGKLNLYGLEPGTYYLKETATMRGYTLLTEPITIVISDDDKDGTATATVNGANAQVTNGVVYLSVENTKNDMGFTLPQTGGPGTLTATAIGLGLLCAGVILLVVYRKKGRKNT